MGTGAVTVNGATLTSKADQEEFEVEFQANRLNGITKFRFKDDSSVVGGSPINIKEQYELIVTDDAVRIFGGRIEVLEPKIDGKTVAFRRELAAVSDADLASARQALGISSGTPVGIFCGSLYPDKRLDFLVDAADQIHRESPGFHCIVLGDGPSMPYMREAAVSRPWLHLLGVTKGAKKALYFRMADFMLNPGLVGLHIVDAFSRWFGDGDDFGCKT